MNLWLKFTYIFLASLFSFVIINDLSLSISCSSGISNLLYMITGCIVQHSISFLFAFVIGLVISLSISFFEKNEKKMPERLIRGIYCSYPILALFIYINSYVKDLVA